ncbi:MAG TPA: 16S rRNA (adenine(1518)-N(6)/adenine(1519)-N(6))-dimethyltransferase RsmA [Candidatus Thermoplasmatota archaeon]|jgi:16S rRNA (adenine1518-N6/adenine1519-N6)-dimethyltransferase|nr:16S rRNA (adenine(1518)-N(6)/adenine(1519)-N(6))-dimethyltransferase RsmA [Candidatus Thermoplasmatota archaeon]
MRRPKLGQHLLIDGRVLERMVGYAELRGDETVLEIGPGRGVLTRALAPRAAKVIAIEKDAEMVDTLHDEGLPGNVEVVLGDALKVDLPDFDKVVANLPYGISSDITFRLLEHDFALGVLTYQREFAERLVAKPRSEQYGRLSVNAYVRADITPLETVPPSAFAPRPRVASLIVRVLPLGKPRFPLQDEALFAEVVRAAFQHRRKTLRNALLDQWPAFAASRDDLLARLAGAPHLEARAETLAPEEFEEVARAVRKDGTRRRRGRVPP